MRVLYITNYATLYGANRSLLSLMRIQKKVYGVTPILLVTGARGTMDEKCAQEEIECVHCNFRNRTVHDDIRYKAFRKMTRNIMRVVDAIRVNHYLRSIKIDYDIVHSNTSIIDVGGYLAKWNRVPHIWHVREFLKDDYHEEIVYGKKEIARKYKKCDVVVAVSDEIKKHVCAYGNNINCIRIYNGIDICAAYEKHFCINNTVNICIVGVVSETKNQFDVVKAVSKLKSNTERKIHLHIVGDYGGEYYSDICKYISENDLEEDVTFYGYCDCVDGLLKSMDIGVMSSEREAFGRVTIEYMANYMAVIGTDSGANRELMDGRFLYPLHNINKLVELMQKLVEDYEWLYRIGHENRIKAEGFTAQVNAEKIYKLYSNCREL